MKKIRITVTAALAASLALQACSSLRPAPAAATSSETAGPPIPRMPSRSAAANLLYYWDFVRALAPRDYAREVEHVRTLYAADGSRFHQLQYAVALSVSPGDARKAQELLEAAQSEDGPGDTELTLFASWLLADISERNRLEGEARKAGAEARRAEACGKRADELDKKLDAMKTIEKSLIQRDTTTDKGKP